jgi:antitoxin component YwqK of YwqJK toxin-antitoxin module
MRSTILKTYSPSLLVVCSFITLVTLLGSGCEKIAEEANLEERNGFVYEIGSDEPFTGNWVKYHKVLEGSRKAFEIHYENGLPQGPFETFYPHGIVETQGSYVIAPKGNRSLKHGTFLAWRKNGTLRHKKIYKNDKLDSICLEFHNTWKDTKDKEANNGNQRPKDAVVKLQVEYANGLREGSYSCFQKKLVPDGKQMPIESGWYQGGKLHGEQTFFYPTINHFRIRDHRKLLQVKRYPATKESFREIVEQAYAIKDSLPTDQNSKDQTISVEAFDRDSKLLAVIWNTKQYQKTTSDYLQKSRKKCLRVWEDGQKKQTVWYDFNEQIVYKEIESKMTSRN